MQEHPLHSSTTKAGHFLGQPRGLLRQFRQQFQAGGPCKLSHCLSSIKKTSRGMGRRLSSWEEADRFGNPIPVGVPWIPGAEALYLSPHCPENRHQHLSTGHRVPSWASWETELQPASYWTSPVSWRQPLTSRGFYLAQTLPPTPAPNRLQSDLGPHPVPTASPQRQSCILHPPSCMLSLQHPFYPRVHLLQATPLKTKTESTAELHASRGSTYPAGSCCPCPAPAPRVAA